MEAKVENPLKPAPLCCSYRLLLAVVGFFGFVNLYALRVNLSVAMVCMVNHTYLALEEEATSGVKLENFTEADDQMKCANQLHNTSALPLDGEFKWPKPTQGLVLGAFFWGYLVTQIPGGVMAERWGGRHVLGWAMLVTAIATLLTPVGAAVSPILLITLRIVKGLGEGVVFPAMHCLWAKWAPPLERSKLIGFTYAGAQIGNVITMPISALLCDYGFAGGWPSIFYVFGAVCVVWFVFWIFLVADSPAQHRHISATERMYIETSIGNKVDHQKEKPTPPWRQIFTSMPVCAIVVAHTCANWGTYTMLTNIPAYMKEVLKFDIKANGALSAIPYIAFWAFINIGGNLADWLRSRGWKTVLVRKLSTACGTVLPGVFLIATGYITCQRPYIAVVLLTIGIGLSGFQYSGNLVNHVDIAPPFAGTLFGLSNTAATVSGIFAPYIVAVLTPHGSQGEWQTVFYVAAAIYVFGAIFYAIFAAGDVQPWARAAMEMTSDPEVREVILVEENTKRKPEEKGKEEEEELDNIGHTDLISNPI